MSTGGTSDVELANGDDRPDGDRWLTQSWDPGQLEPELAYKLLVGSVLPRPIAWVSTLSRDGVPNVAPFSFFTVASRQPPVLAISIGQPADPGKRAKDTLRCLREVGQFVVNIATEALLEQVVATSVEYPAHVDEFAAAGLSPVGSDVVSVPRIGQAPIAMECRVRQLLQLGTDVLVLGDVARFHVRRDLIDGRLRIDTGALRPLGRMAGPVFCVGMNLVTRAPKIVVDASTGEDR